MRATSTSRGPTPTLPAGNDGLGIVDIERAGAAGRSIRCSTRGGKIDDTNDVKIGMTNASLFAYLADGHNGLQVVQLFSPESNPNHYGFSPRPTPSLIASYPIHGGALMISEGIDRDRAADESGNQLAVFGRRGARPFTAAEAASSTSATENSTRSRTSLPARPRDPTEGWLAAVRRCLFSP